MRKKILIIGNGASGNAALEEILQHPGKYEVTVITNENLPIYYRPMLSEYLSTQELPKRFFLHDQEWYANHDVQFITELMVTKISPDSKEATLNDGTLIPYDELILATGSNNFIPSMNGANLEGVFSLRTLADAHEIKTACASTSKVVIIGGGLLGLEMGWQLKKIGKDVTVVEMMPRLLPRQLDEDASELFEQKVLATGIKILKGVETKEILGTTKVTGVALGDATILEADMVLFSIGVRANTTLAKDAGALVERGIVVDDFMKTNLPDVYAVGDCAEHKGINYAIWPEAIAQGKVAGLNVMGHATVYEPVIPFHIYHGLNMRLFSIGDVGSNPALTYDCIIHNQDGNYERIFFVDDILVGAILIGNISKSSLLKKGLADKMTKMAYLENVNRG